MIDTLKAWLNGTRHYNLGVEIFAMVSNDEALINVFRRGESMHNKWKLGEELQKICSELKLKKNGKAIIKHSAASASKKSSEFKKPQHIDRSSDEQFTAVTISDPAVIEISNSQLYEACKLEADNLYKQAMNKRAVLFSMVPSDAYEDINRPDLVLQRSPLSIEAVELYNKASELYDKANFVKQHGRLPGAEVEADQDVNYNSIPDSKVKQTLDNLRKNYNKIDKREKTPERIALLQKHKANIEILEERWRSLKQQ